MICKKAYKLYAKILYCEFPTIQETVNMIIW